ncbi:tyrosine-type recombinase/integrase [Pedobacter sp. BS3]|uniref:tyrosine-type recombinase/integrase n=1 Tax=Pedobacter sp. BS3 TaxID=2567937 RepID=UPI0016599297|nr:site-specific integrase [Pedobacter sp. BS3]
MKPKWEGPFIYEPPGGDLTKDWFVWLNYQHPITGQMVRAGRYSYGFAQYNTKTERRQHALALKAVIEELLKEGWNPFEEYNVFDHQQDNRVVTLIDNYLKEIKGSIRPNTYRKYETELNLFKKWLETNGFSGLQMNEVKKAVVTSFLQEYKLKKEWKGKTYNNYLNDITTFFNYYHENYDEVIEKVPTVSLKRQPTLSPGNQAWNDWQFKKLKEWMLEDGEDLLYIFCSFIYYGALRNEAEANYLRAGDFNFKIRTLKIESGTAKNRTTEYIPIYPDFLELLYELKIDQLPADYYIFGKTKNQRFVAKKDFVIGAPYQIGQDYFARHFRPYKKRLGIPDEEHGIYRYKHTRAVHLGEDGEDLYKIMKLFRHRDLATTMIYMRGLGVDTQNTEYTKGRKF